MDTNQIKIIHADLAHPVERDLPKVEVAGSSPVIRSMYYKKRVFYRFGSYSRMGKKGIKKCRRKDYFESFACAVFVNRDRLKLSSVTLKAR